MDQRQSDQPAGRRRSLFDPIGLIADAVVPTLTDAVDVDDIVRRMDVDDVVRRIDIDDVVRRIDADVLLSRVDLDAVISRIDVDAIVDRMDIDRIVQRADLAGIVAQSTRGVTANMMDVVRRQLAGIDEIVTRVAARLVGRDPTTDPDGPSGLIHAQTPPLRDQERASITGHYAGPVARGLALVLDVWTILFVFGAVTALAGWMLKLFLSGDDVDVALAPIWWGLLLACWAFVYLTLPEALAGRTFGKAVVGLRVVSRDGTPLPTGRVVVRVLVLPLSIALLGLGLIGAVFGRHRRTLHDVAAHSVEVIDWGDRPADLPTRLDDWLTQRDARSAVAKRGTAVERSS